MPYIIEWLPVELLATIPPMAARLLLAGSGPNGGPMAGVLRLPLALLPVVVAVVAETGSPTAGGLSAAGSGRPAAPGRGTALLAGFGGAYVAAVAAAALAGDPRAGGPGGVWSAVAVLGGAAAALVAAAGGLVMLQRLLARPDAGPAYALGAGAAAGAWAFVWGLLLALVLPIDGPLHALAVLVCAVLIAVVAAAIERFGLARRLGTWPAVLWVAAGAALLLALRPG